MTKTVKEEPTTTAEEAAAEAKVRKILSRGDIFDAADLASEEVEVREWGGTVIVRALTGAERDAYENEIFQMRGQGKGLEYNLSNIRAKLVARTVVGETGERLFSDTDIAKLGTKSATALNRVFTVAQRLSALTQTDVNELTEQMGNALSVGSGSA